MSEPRDSVSLRLSKEMIKWLKERKGQTWSEQLREDLAVYRALLTMRDEGMGDRPLGQMLQMAESLVRSK